MKFENKIGSVEIITETPIKFSVETKSSFLYLHPSTFSSYKEALNEYKEVSIKLQLIEILDSYTTEMEGYSYFGSNPGISTDVYDEIVDDIMKKFEVNIK